MPRTRWIALTTLAAAAVAAAGAAAAHRSQTTQQATATFAAGSVSREHTTTCTASDGTYQETDATYTGSASSSDPRLNGTLRIRARSVVNTSTGLGWVQGSFRLDGSQGGARGLLEAAVAAGAASGFLRGEAGRPAGKLLATVTARFTPTGGFDGGSLGSGTVAGAGVVFRPGTCAKTKRARTVFVAGLRFGSRGVHGRAAGTFTLDVARDSSGAVSGATATFYVNYRFAGAVTIDGVTLDDSHGTVAIDAGTGTIADADGSGNVTKVVSGVPASVAQALLANPRDYVVQLSTSAGDLRSRLDGFQRHR